MKVLITGATSGIGTATAQAFSQKMGEDCELFLTGRREDRLEEIQRALSPSQVKVAYLDVRDSSQIEELVCSNREWFQDIDILINNAGLAAGAEKAFEANLDDWDQMIDTNVKGLLTVTRKVLPFMVARKNGFIINIGSIAGVRPYPGGSAYCATKAAVGAFSEALRYDLLGTGVRVASVFPGMVETEFSLVRFKGDQAQADQVYSGMQPLMAKDIAESIFWIAQQPKHVTVQEVLITATDQAGTREVHRG